MSKQPKPIPEGIQAATRMYDMLKQDGAEGIEHLDPAGYAGVDAAPEDAAVAKLEALLQRQIELLDRFEVVVRKLEAQHQHPPVIIQAPPTVPRQLPIDHEVVKPQITCKDNRTDAGQTWARGLTDRPIGSQ